MFDKSPANRVSFAGIFPALLFFALCAGEAIAQSFPGGYAPLPFDPRLDYPPHISGPMSAVPSLYPDNATPPRLGPQSPRVSPGVPRFAAPALPRRAESAQRMTPRLLKDQTPDGYRLTILLGANQQAGDIQIRPRGRSLMISSEHERILRSERQLDQGRGFQRSFSVSSGRFQRRVSVPPDANLDAMRREDQEDAIILTLPRY